MKCSSASLPVGGGINGECGLLPELSWMRYKTTVLLSGSGCNDVCGRRLG
jgi:hypothetical protein